MTLRLPDELAAKLTLVARLDGVSAAEIARQALVGYLDQRLGDERLRDRLDDAHAAEREQLNPGDG